MKKAIIVTASYGIGLKLAEVSKQFDIKSEIAIVAKAGIGEPPNSTEKSNKHAAYGELYSTIDSDDDSFDYLIWSTGVFLQKSLSETTDVEMDTLIDLHYSQPLKIIRDIHKKNNKPYHFITIASCSSWRLRHQEAIYCGLSAAKAAFTRNFANDLTAERPGSKIMLVNPGGVKTPFFYEKEIEDTSGYLDQDNLARFIWQTAIEQKKSFEEIQFLRDKNVKSEVGVPIIEFVVKNPETIATRDSSI